MTSTISYQWTKVKSAQLGIKEEVLSCALDILFQNRNLVNAIDNKIEMDDYIYRAVLKQAFTQYKKQSQIALEEGNLSERLKAEKDLSVISREEIVTDPFYRAVLPLLIKVVSPEPILRMHAELTSTIVLDLADFKRKHRSTSVTEILVRHCAAELQGSSII
jgi:Fic family protein